MYSSPRRTIAGGSSFQDPSASLSGGSGSAERSVGGSRLYASPTSPRHSALVVASSPVARPTDLLIGPSVVNHSPIATVGSGSRNASQVNGSSSPTAASLIELHDVMASRFDEHVVKRREIEHSLSSLIDNVGRVLRGLEDSFSSSHPTHSSQSAARKAQHGHMADGDNALVARLECEVEFLEGESRLLNEMRTAKKAMCAEIEEALGAEERQWSHSSERKALLQLGDMSRECAELEKQLRREENRLLESADAAEARQREEELRKRELAAKKKHLENSIADLEITNSALTRDLKRAEIALQERTLEKQEWEKRLRNARIGSSGGEDETDAVLSALISQRKSLEGEKLMLERLSAALRQNEVDSLQDPNSAYAKSVVTLERPSDETSRLIWEATRPVRNVLSLRETLLVLKAHLLNLYDDLDEITTIVESIQSDPQAQHPPFSELSTQWRQQKLYDAFQDVCDHMKGRYYETDPNAALALLTKMKYFVVIYDLFENHFDAVVNAIMLSDGKWVEANDMLAASVVSRRVLADAKKASTGKRRSTSLTSAAPQRVSQPPSSRR